MPLPRLTERSLYEPLGRWLSNLGFGTVVESEVEGRFPDLIAWYKSEKFVIQVRIDGDRTRRGLLDDAYEAARRADTLNIVTLLYPKTIRRSVTDDQMVDRLALDTQVISDVFSSYLTHEVQDSAKNVFVRIKEAVDRGTRKTDIEVAVGQLSREVEDLALVLRRVTGSELEPALQSVVGRFDLFMALGERSPEDARLAGIDLMAYLLLNQLMFYQIYAARTGAVDPLPATISSLRDLTTAFRRIRKIDFVPVYSIELSELLPSTQSDLVRTLNSILAKMRLIRPENVELDLLGRFFHELLPWKTRKILAAFYTHPISAEVLAGLSIGAADEKVMDLACGSGTLLVADYRRKQTLLGRDRSGHVHNKLLRELTGIDIMPFATHLTAVNLSVQSARHKANYLRVSANDSLELFPGKLLKTFSRQLQANLYGLTDQVSASGAVGLTEAARPFVVDRVDVITINPPFTDREKMPDDFRDKLNGKTGTPEVRKRIQKLISIVGGAPNLWAYFLALADGFLGEQGTVGAILPTNILRGKNTRAVRDLLMNRYNIRYIVRASRDYGFTEGSELRDLILVASKASIPAKDPTCVVWVKSSIRSLTEASASDLVRSLRSLTPGRSVETDVFDATWLQREQLLTYRDNLTPLISYSSLASQRTITAFLRRMRENRLGILSTFPRGLFFEGFHTSPKGRSKVLCLTNPISEERLEQALMRIETVSENRVTARYDNNQIDFDPEGLLPALRSLTSLRKMDVADSRDYIAVAPYPDFPRVAQIASWRGDMDWESVKQEAEAKRTHLAIPRKFNFYSPNFHLFGFFCDAPYVPFDFLKGVRVPNTEDAKLLCLFFNSIAFICQAFAYREETQVRFPELREEDLILLQGLDLTKLASTDRAALLQLFEKMRSVSFPSLTEQLETKDRGRVALDRAILSAMGFDLEEIESFLEPLYDALIREFKATRGLRKSQFHEY